MASRTADITIYFLNGSRAIRIVWLMEELGLDYKLVTAQRLPNGAPPNWFTAEVPTKMKNSPAIKDGDLVLQESVAITEYICEMYSSSSNLIPNEVLARTKVREWMAASEGTYLLHAVTILYPRMHGPDAIRPHLPELEEALSGNIRRCVNHLESALSTGPSGGKFLVGTDLTAADIMMGFSIDTIFKAKLGTAREFWPHTSAWLDGLLQRDAYKTAVQKSGYQLTIL